MGPSPQDTPDHAETYRPVAAPGDQPNTSAVAFPPTVMSAGIIWIAYGVFVLSLLASSLFASEASLHVFRWPDLPVVALVGFWGGGFLYGGVRCIRGRATDTRGIALVSIILAFFHIGTGATNANWHPGVFLVNVPIGLVLLVAGVFAVTGRLDYLRWRRAHGT